MVSLKLTIFLLLPAGPLPDPLEQLEEVLHDHERRGEAGPLVVLLDQPVHLPLPHVVRVLVDLLEHRPADMVALAIIELATMRVTMVRMVHTISKGELYDLVFSWALHDISEHLRRLK